MRHSERCGGFWRNSKLIRKHLAEKTIDKKMTRRAVLGTAIAGLVASPFVIRALREPKHIPVVAPYGKIDVEPGAIGSELTPEEVRESFDALSLARDSFLKFRGFTGNIQVDYNTSGTVFPKGESESGYFSLHVDLADPMRSNGGVAVTKVDMKFSPQKGAAPVWTFLLNGTRSPENPPVINNETGDNTDIFLVYHWFYRQLVWSDLSTGMFLRTFNTGRCLEMCS